jgi:hypothetical protein
MDLKPNETEPTDILSLTFEELHRLAEEGGMTMVEVRDSLVKAARSMS